MVLWARRSWSAGLSNRLLSTIAIMSQTPEVPELTSDEEREIVHAAMDRYYRDLLDQPIPTLGNISPRKAARSKKDPPKLANWVKQLENRTAKHASDDAMASLRRYMDLGRASAPWT